MIEPSHLRLVTLSENTAASIGMLGEWGLSILVETPDIKVLLDTGLSISAAHNADALGIDLSSIDRIVLSHGHIDHTGGLRPVLSRARHDIEIIAHPDAWGSKYSKPPREKAYRYRGIPFQREDLENLGARFSLTAGPTWITPDIVVSGQVPMATEYETIDKGLFLKQGNSFIPDPLDDDQSLFLKTELGLVVVAGCAHRGIINTLRCARRLTGMDRVYMVVGGTHLYRASEEQIALTIAELREAGVRRLGVSHCTGMAAAARLSQEFGDSFFFNNAGNIVTFTETP